MSAARVTSNTVRTSHDKTRFSTTRPMTRLLPISLAVALAASVVAQAQPQPSPAPQTSPKPKAGTIIDSSQPGRITDAPVTQGKPAVPAPITAPSAGAGATGQKIERFEAVGNATVASDTIRVYLGVQPGEADNPDARQSNL